MANKTVLEHLPVSHWTRLIGQHVMLVHVTAMLQSFKGKRLAVSAGCIAHGCRKRAGECGHAFMMFVCLFNKKYVGVCFLNTCMFIHKHVLQVLCNTWKFQGRYYMPAEIASNYVSLDKYLKKKTNSRKIME